MLRVKRCITEPALNLLQGVPSPRDRQTDTHTPTHHAHEGLEDTF